MSARPGTVYLVGAGPGDPGLITVKGLEILRTADVVVYDRLAPQQLLDRARDDAELVDAGKGRGSHRMSQSQINATLVEAGMAGKSVCRLKGGDPFVFGRGGEEAIELAAAGVAWEVVPGVTSAVAAPAYAGIPVTQRGASSSFTVVTGSQDPSDPDSHMNWDALAQLGGTLVFVMGWKSLPEITKELIARGAPPDRPSALVQWGTTPRQRTVAGTLENITELGEQAGLGAPVALAVGDVVGLRDALAWFDRRPLFGKRVLVTRARSQASRLAEALEAKGADVVQFPAIQVVAVADPQELDAAIKSIDRYDWLTFTSSNSVRGLKTRMQALGADARALSHIKIAAVGPATANAVRDIGIEPDLVPEDFTAEAVVKKFKELEAEPRRVLALRSDIGRETLPDGLRGLGAEVDEVVAYETHIPEETEARARAAYSRENGGIDITTFASSSAVRNLVRLLDGDAALINSSTVACIGPVTAGTAREMGVRVDVIAAEQSINGLVQSLVSHFGKGG